MIATNPIVKAFKEYKGSNRQSYLHENHWQNWNIFWSTLLLYENSIGGSSPCSAHCKELQQHITHLFHLLLASYTHPTGTEPTTWLNTLAKRKAGALFFFSQKKIWKGIQVTITCGNDRKESDSDALRGL